MKWNNESKYAYIHYALRGKYSNLQLFKRNVHYKYAQLIYVPIIKWGLHDDQIEVEFRGFAIKD